MSGSTSGAWNGPTSATTTPANAVTAASTTTATNVGGIRRVKHLIVDSGAIIKEVPLHDLADNLWTIPDVIQEIKDRRARHVLQSLPKKLQLKEPSPQALKAIVQFSRLTGDFRSISDADIKVCAYYLLGREAFLFSRCSFFVGVILASSTNHVQGRHLLPDGCFANLGGQKFVLISENCWDV